ncbi:hypothetical protein ASPACDRAFT_43254 [Aspergillus aculeatus ATCC 16872]|uniref:F-box domain-containing protein n=1 Tax=Aspergillus aculeatus (strain ATCC 16872 / CBS 172.66 / WB 5094) TaxID=690307 RepID=A0A1L9WTV6_ASPA1|nr:uncharacterized protein ASPACDRAFT_43254 [Aspergillus aculeatus ATCC 16872]OJJ99630.1 hypothetical protein ASPACDRAFT_43254 [Aspergillus aculeatus ATCC 16872]
MSGIRLISESTYVFLNLTDHTLDDVDESLRLDKQLKLDPHSARYGLGALEKLPLEILHLTLLALDVQSMTDFRRVNKRARIVAGSIPQYRRILAHAPAALRGSLNLETARNFSCQALYETLSTAECNGCGDFGGYLYLITCRRVCFLCLTEKTDYLPLSRKDVFRKFGLDPTHLARLPRMKSFPGHYSPRGIKCRRRETLFDHCSAREAGIAVHGTAEAMERFAAEMVSKQLEAYNSRLPLRQTSQIPGRLPRSEDAFDGHSAIRHPLNGGFTVWLAKPIIIVGRFTGVGSILSRVTETISEKVGK